MTLQSLWVTLCGLSDEGRKEIDEIVEEMKERDSRLCTRIFFSYATILANLIFFVPFSLTLREILSQIFTIFCQRIILSEKILAIFSPKNCLVRKKVFNY